MGTRQPSESDDFRTFIKHCIEELRLKTRAHDAAWNLGECYWSVDQDSGTIVFTNPNGISATGPVQIIGTYNVEDNTWLWAWDNPSVDPSLQKHAKHVRKYGETNRIRNLTTRKLACTEEEAWELTAVACKLCAAQGAYRGPAGPARVFMTFGELQLSKQSAELAERESEFQSNPHSRSDSSESDASEVRQIVEAFIAALHNWKVEANANRKKQNANELATKKYAELMRQRCDESVTPQPIAYASPPNHDPEKEMIIAVDTRGDECTVTTKRIDEIGLETIYEYHLRQKLGRWYITSLLFVEGHEKYECL